MFLMPGLFRTPESWTWLWQFQKASWKELNRFWSRGSPSSNCWVIKCWYLVHIKTCVFLSSRAQSALLIPKQHQKLDICPHPTLFGDALFLNQLTVPCKKLPGIFVFFLLGALTLDKNCTCHKTLKSIEFTLLLKIFILLNILTENEYTSPSKWIEFF